MPEHSHFEDGPQEFPSENYRIAYEKQRAELAGQADNPVVDANNAESREWAESVGSAEDWAADVQAGNLKYKEAWERDRADIGQQLKDARRQVEESSAPGKVVPVEAERNRGLGHHDDWAAPASTEAPVPRSHSEFAVDDRATGPIPRVDSRFAHAPEHHPRHERVVSRDEELASHGMGPSLKGAAEPPQPPEPGRVQDRHVTREFPAVQAEAPEPGMMARMGAYLRKRLGRRK